MIALYRGTSLISRLIRFFNYSPYSHAAWIDDDATCYQAWKGGVRHDPSLGTRHTPGTAIDLFSIPAETPAIRSAVRDFLAAQVGKNYDYLAILGFIIRAPRLQRKNRWFCSELIAEAYAQAGLPLLNQPPHKIYPGMLATSPLLKHIGGTRTGGPVGAGLVSAPPVPIPPVGAKNLSPSPHQQGRAAARPERNPPC